MPPPDPAAGDNILEWARKMSRFVRQLIPRESNDVYPEIGPGGTKYSLRRTRPGTGGGIGTVRCFIGLEGETAEADVAMVIVPDP